MADLSTLAARRARWLPAGAVGAGDHVRVAGCEGTVTDVRALVDSEQVGLRLAGRLTPVVVDAAAAVELVGIRERLARAWA